MRVFIPWLRVALGGVALLLAACNSGDGGAVEVRMLDNTFAPFVVEVTPDQPVRFVNQGRVPHNAIAVDGAFSTLVASTGSNQDPGDAVTVTVAEPGVYSFYCSLHATQNAAGEWEGMVGTLIVGEAATAAEVVSAASEAPARWTGTTRAVPSKYPTIQAAVDAADPGDLVLVAPGVYREAVSITTPGLTLRGENRNTTILDGEFTRENGVTVTADGVAVENLTARNYTVNGFFWNGVTGYRGSYLTAIDDWVYGIYAFDSVDGLLEHSYASGSFDAGFYIGQCDPCNAVVTNVLAEFNGLGYSGTNASGNIYIVDSEWRHNVAGIVPNTLDSELLPPANHVVVAGNYVHHNGEAERAPNGTFEWAAYGNGILLAGVRDSVVRNNLLLNNRSGGVAVISMIDKNIWPSGGNRVVDNIVRGSGRADLLLGGPLEQGTCFGGNDASTTVPLLLRQLHACQGINLPMVYGMAASSEPMGRLAQVTHGQNPQLEHGDAPKPDLTFEQLPGRADAPVHPAVHVFASLEFDPAAITTPQPPADVVIAERRPALMGIALDSGFWPVLLGALLWWIPALAWLFGTIWALWRIPQSHRARRTKVLWSIAVLILPVVGVLAYLILAHASPLRPRLLIGLAAPLAWVVAVVAALLIGGVF